MAPSVHKLKTIGHYFDAMVAGDKTFEVRRNDREFQKGDVLELIRLEGDGPQYSRPPGEPYGTVRAKFQITYLLQGGQFGIAPGYCVLGLASIKQQHRDDLCAACAQPLGGPHALDCPYG
jgi:hypothetical protein